MDTGGDDERTPEERLAYGQLAALLDERLDERRSATPSWTELLETSDPAGWQRWTVGAREHVLGLLDPWPGPVMGPVPEREFWFARDGVTAWKVRIPTHPHVNLLSVLLVPDSADTPQPAVLALHGTGGNLQKLVSDVDYHHGFAMELARNGFVVLAPYRPAESVTARLSLRARAYAGGWSLEAIQLWQLVRAVDYLVSLEWVDPERVGVYGISWGGTQTIQLGAIDERLGMVLVSGHFTDRYTTLRERLFETPDLGVGFAGMIAGVIPHMTFLLDDVNLVGLIQPRYFAVEVGNRDRLYEGATSEFAKVARLYGHVGHDDRARFLSFQGGHEISVETVLPFLQDWASTSRSK
jgi:hypothetical protein